MARSPDSEPPASPSPSARIGSWIGELPSPVTPLVLSFIAALGTYDVLTRRRVHWATMLGAALIVLVNATMQLSGIGPALVAQRLAQ